jgi:hypothetical protein
LPASPGAFEPTIAEGLGFVAKFDAQTGTRVFLTYLGDGNGTPFGRIAPPSDGSVWNDQSTNGPLAGHPLAVTPGRFSPYYPGLPGDTTSHTYVEQISADGTPQPYATFLDNIVSLNGDGTVRVYDPPC